MTPGVQTTSVQPNTRCGPSCSVARIEDALAVELLAAAAADRAARRAAAVTERNLERIDVDVGA